MDSAHPISHSTLESNPEQVARARAWAYVFECYRKKEAAPESRPDDARKDQDAGTYSNCT